MSVSEYAVTFNDLSRHAPTLVSTVRERICRFIEGLNDGIRFNMAREFEIDTPYQQVVEMAQRLEGIQGREREDREAKRPRGTGGFSGGHAIVTARHGRCYVSRPVHSALPASSDYHAKTVALAMPGFPWLEWRGVLDYIPSRVVSFLKSQWMVKKGCDAYLDVNADTPTIESVSVVRDFPDVFSADLSGMPPDRDIDFGIDLLPGTQPISIPLYRIAPA
ncbi:uncharacterized protein [Nicotiana tomentosiformis]|uniref:uncharacterized protein n=1 Tax=Nicotiana tomentosiformis TaxID=4098 RepID=UPI00388CD52A